MTSGRKDDQVDKVNVAEVELNKDDESYISAINVGPSCAGKCKYNGK